MGMIGFSMFRSKVEDGSKPHTIRFRKIPPQVGEELYLWWKSRTKEGELIGITVCTKVDEIRIDAGRKLLWINGVQHKAIGHLAAKDGFDTVREFWQFFSKSDPDQIGYLIHWEPDYITQRRIRPIVVSHGNFEQDKTGKINAWKPSNGSCGTAFTEYWCGKCSRDKFNPETNRGDSCPIMMQALLGEQPKQWIEFEDDVCCTAFSVPKPAPTAAAKYAALERKGQLNLLRLT